MLKSIGLSLLLASFMAGCHHQNTATPPRLPDDYLDWPRGYLVKHNSFSIFLGFRPGVDLQAVKRDIIAFLTGSTMVQAQFPTDETGPLQLRPSDFWALALARMTEQPLQISVADSPKERDEKISHLLRQVARPAAAGTAGQTDR